jgi:hypothetical protein
MSEPATVEDVARALRSPFVPGVFRALDAAPGYLDGCWPRIAPSVETAGFVGSALYLADMARDAVVEDYEPMLSPARLAERGVDADEVARILDVLDVLLWVQPQVLLICAALLEALDSALVGGQGRAEPRETTDSERRHLATPVTLLAPETAPLPGIAEALQTAEPPDLYRAVAVWPAYLDFAWDELQHLSAYPPLRRRARALYYYARSSTRALAFPLAASTEALLAAGVTVAAIADARATLEAALPVLSTMVVHCAAMRAGLGATAHEVAREG